jgi:uncharacterized membrane protein HdeD (DUF308 family)
MLEVMGRNWWMLLVRGIAAVLFGVAVLVWPGIALTVLVLLWGAYALVDGVFAIVMGVQGRAYYRDWWVTVLEGVVSIIAGVVAFIWPGVTAVALLYVVAAWAIITGLLEIVAAIQLRKEINGEFWLGLSGVLSVGMGVLLALYPGAGMVSLLWVLGIYAIVFGVALIILSFRVRGLAQGHSEQQQARPA